MTPGKLLLQVDTPAGVFIREVMPATLLPQDPDHGKAAEEATRNAAAFWGLPDFVFRPTLVAKASGNREVGDALVVVGDKAASIQVKAREGPAEEVGREKSWLDKKIREAARQASGTIRSMRLADAVPLVNERGRRIMIRGQEMTWLRVIVIDHPGVDGYIPAADSVVLLRRDWEFLFDQLRSTYAVLEYLQRISSQASIPLGDEPLRYYELAAADAAAPPSAPDRRLFALGHEAASVPLLPQAPAGHGDDEHHILVRLILEDLATSGLADESDRLDVLAAIDAVPVSYRAELGRDVLQWLREVSEVPYPAITWRFRGMPWTDRPFVLVGTAGAFDGVVQEQFNAYVSLRHQQLIELIPERTEVMTVGVLLTPRDDDSRPWDTTIAATRGEQGLDALYRAALEQLWGQIGESKQHVNSPDT